MKKNGFTIVETSLVLAIGGLILVLAFIVLPGLWRNQRDSQRKDDLMIFADAIKKWQSNNNRGALPGNEADLITVKTKYISKSFEDPLLGTAYTFAYYNCNGKASTDTCSNAMSEISKETEVTGKIHFVASASCGDENKAVKSASGRKAALIYKLEVGDYYCYDF